MSLAPETRQRLRDGAYAVGVVLGAALVVLALGMAVLWGLEVIAR